jgi:hypothetical protein
MDGEHDTDTYSQKEVQPYILRESNELAETTVVADNRKRKESVKVTTTIRRIQTSRLSICIIPIMEECN